MGLGSPPCLGSWPGCLQKWVAHVLEDWGCCQGATGKPHGPPAGSKVFKTSTPHHHRSSHACELARLLETRVSSSRLAKLPLISKLWPEVLASCGSQPWCPVLQGEEGTGGLLAKQACATGTQVREQVVPGDGKKSRRVGYLAGEQYSGERIFLFLIIKASRGGGNMGAYKSCCWVQIDGLPSLWIIYRNKA